MRFRLAFASFNLLLVFLVGAEFWLRFWHPLPPVLVTGEREFFQDDELLGQMAKPSVSVSTEKKFSGKNIFSTSYTSDELGWRQTPIGTEGKRNRFLLLIGSSHAFGYGVSDESTIPYHLGALDPSFHAYNLAMPSFGINSFYALAKHFERYTKVREQNGEIVLFFHSLAIERTIGTLRTVLWGAGNAPYYRLSENKSLIYG